MNESAIQRAIGDLLEATGQTWLDTSKPGGVVQLRHKLRGGYPDLTVLLPNRPPVGLEVKAPTGRVGGKQREFACYLERGGMRVFVVRSVEDAHTVLRAFTGSVEDRKAAWDAAWEMVL